MKNLIDYLTCPIIDYFFKPLILYPKNNKQIIKIINKAKKKNKIIIVSDEVKYSDAYHISLHKYNMPEYDILIDHITFCVTINAGWTVYKLCSELANYSYCLESDPCDKSISIYEMITRPTYGTRLGSGLIKPIALTLIDDNGGQIMISNTEPDFNMYILNRGVTGIIINATFKIEKIHRTVPKIKVFNIKLFNLEIMNHLRKIINVCNTPNSYKHNQCTIDLNNNHLTSYNYSPTYMPGDNLYYIVVYDERSNIQLDNLYKFIQDLKELNIPIMKLNFIKENTHSIFYSMFEHDTDYYGTIIYAVIRIKEKLKFDNYPGIIGLKIKNKYKSKLLLYAKPIFVDADSTAMLCSDD